MGLRERLRPMEADLGRNLPLFGLLVLVNGFVGTMVGMERTLVPLLGEQVFGLGSKAAVLSFIATFGLVKAFSNLFAGALAERRGRRALLLWGWLAGLPVPFLLMFAPPPHWWLVLLANVLLGVNQGLCWSMAVVMKVDIAGEKRRGLALGLNEFAGYASVGLAAFLTGWLAGEFGLRPIPFLVGVAASLAGLALTWALVPDTLHLARPQGPAPGVPWSSRLGDLRRLSARGGMLTLNQAGLVNNLNDGVAWGLLPLLFAGSLAEPGAVGLLVALYPLTWGMGQLLTGPLSDRVGRKPLIVAGFVVQAAGLGLLAMAAGFAPWVAAMLLLGLGTAMVYPTLLGAVSDAADPGERATSLGVYRFWRDLGYVAGALGGGAIADLAGLEASLGVVGALTLFSGIHVAATLPRPPGEPAH